MIQGAKTRQARTSHYIAVDAVHDELVVPNPFAQAIIVLPGGAKGNDSPLRVIQGPRTLLSSVDNVAVDPVHNEIFTASFPNDAIFVYKREADGDVAPIRVIHGPNTKLDRPIRVDVDPANNLIGVVTDHNIMFYNRTDDGDAAPKWILGGDKVTVGAQGGSRDVRLFGEGRKIIAGGVIRAAAEEGRGGRGAGRGGRGAGAAEGGEGSGGGGRGGQRFLGVWNYGDTGDAMPLYILNNNQVTKIPGTRLALDPVGGDLIVGGDGQVSVYHLPEIFAKPTATK